MNLRTYKALSIQLIPILSELLRLSYQVLYGAMKSYIMDIATLYWKDRKTQGGGVLLAVDDNIPSYVLPTPSEIEAVTVQVSLSLTCIVCCIKQGILWPLLCLYQEFIRRTIFYHYYGGI